MDLHWVYHMTRAQWMIDQGPMDDLSHYNVVPFSDIVIIFM